MAITLASLVPSLKREVNPPGIDVFPDALNSEWEGHLADGFTELILAGYISGFTIDDGSIVEDTATPTNDLSIALQQLTVIAAGMRILRVQMMNQDTLFRTKAGPVEYETRKSALTLDSAMKHLQERFNAIVATLPNTNSASATYISDIATSRISPYNNPYSIFIGH